MEEGGGVGGGREKGEGGTRDWAEEEAVSEGMRAPVIAVTKTFRSWLGEKLQSLVVTTKCAVSQRITACV